MNDNELFIDISTTADLSEKAIEESECPTENKEVRLHLVLTNKQVCCIFLPQSV